MAPLALLDLATLAGCPPAQDRHRLDCLARWLIANGWQGAQRIGATEPLEIRAGIGLLRIGPDGEDWQPATKATARPEPEPLPAPEPLRAARLAMCATCDRYSSGRCDVGGCGCAGMGKAERLFSKCPLGRWPP